ncbi:MAG: hypothetical protein ACREA9_23390 [Pyrinomonadaceae bacterium]
MKPKLVVAIVLACLFTIVAIISGINHFPKITIGHAQSQDPARQSFTFEGMAQRALARGSNTVKLETTVEGIDVASLDDALAKYSVIVVRPTYAQSFRAGDLSIETWYKLRVIETISQKPYVPPCDSCGSPSNPLSGVPAPAADEFLSYETGGTLIVNGVTFVETAGLPLLFASNTYVLFSNINPANKVATVVGGGFKLSADNSTLVPLDIGDSPSCIVTGVSSRFGNSLNQLRAALN